MITKLLTWLLSLFEKPTKKESDLKNEVENLENKLEDIENEKADINDIIDRLNK